MRDAIEIEVYETARGKNHYLDWTKKLSVQAQAILDTRIARLRAGNFGDCKSIRGARGLHEMRIHAGPGYRIYFTKEGNRLVILLCGGDKGKQSGDITRARKLLEEYRRRKDETDC